MLVTHDPFLILTVVSGDDEVPCIIYINSSDRIQIDVEGIPHLDTRSEVIGQNERNSRQLSAVIHTINEVDVVVCVCTKQVEVLVELSRIVPQCGCSFLVEVLHRHGDRACSYE